MLKEHTVFQTIYCLRIVQSLTWGERCLPSFRVKTSKGSLVLQVPKADDQSQHLSMDAADFNFSVINRFPNQFLKHVSASPPHQKQTNGKPGSWYFIHLWHQNTESCSPLGCFPVHSADHLMVTLSVVIERNISIPPNTTDCGEASQHGKWALVSPVSIQKGR